MNVKYYYEFEGTDKVLNRVEMLCDGSVTREEIKGGASPFILEYPEVKKLEPVQSSGAKLNLISERVFRFLDLHTDDMQGYLIKFYRTGVLYWIGYLDSELYVEDLSATPPYPVEFSAADFNILERLKFQDENEKRYTDITTLLTQIKRCFDRLNLPFLRLYIGCSTVVEDVAISASETALHKLYIQSSNFYDEDGEPMSCREVIESILEPFGLVMVQRDACVYIYDYNTIKAGGVMKCYDFGTLNYQGDVAVPVVLGDLSEIGFASTDATLGFEEMINNTVISCSPYMSNPLFEGSIKKESVSNLSGTVEKTGYTEEIYTTCEKMEPVNGTDFIRFLKNESESDIVGVRLSYGHTPTAIVPKLKIVTNEYLLGTNKSYYLNIKANIYLNTRKNPFDNEEETKALDSSRAIRLYCNLYLVDTTGKPIMYCWNSVTPLWYLCEKDGSFPQGRFILFFANNTRDEHGLPDIHTLDKWITNSNQMWTEQGEMGYRFDGISELNYAKGVNVSLQSVVYPVNGIPVFEITNKCMINNPALMYKVEPFPKEQINNILANNVSITLLDSDKKNVTNRDCEFKSYINKKVATDFETKELKVTSCNEEEIPAGKGCILALKDNLYTLQLKYTRGGQTDVLERLLMCTIHSNFTTKNRNISVDIKMTENPAMRYVTYNGILPSKGMLVKGCSMDFDTSVTRITAADFSEDTVKLSSLPYNE